MAATGTVQRYPSPPTWMKNVGSFQEVSQASSEAPERVATSAPTTEAADRADWIFKLDHSIMMPTRRRPGAPPVAVRAVARPFGAVGLAR